MNKEYINKLIEDLNSLTLEEMVERNKGFLGLMDLSFEEQCIEPTIYESIDVYDVIKNIMDERIKNNLRKNNE